MGHVPPLPFAVEPPIEEGGYVGFDHYDIVTQDFTLNHVTVSPDGTGRLRRIPFRYAWPAEMDLMTRIAGMAAERPSGGLGPLRIHRRQHRRVSVWQKR